MLHDAEHEPTKTGVFLQESQKKINEIQNTKYRIAPARSLDGTGSPELVNRPAALAGG